MPEKLIYKETLPISRGKAERIFSTGKREDIVDALCSIAFHDPDWKWVQETCIRFTENSNPNIRGVAAMCFGDIARVHHKLDINIVVPILNKLMHDNDKDVQEWAETGLDDIKHFLKRRYRYFIKKNPKYAGLG